MHKDPDADLLLRLKQNKDLADYVQMHECTPRVPLAMVFFQNRQIELMRTLRKANRGHIVAHVDATGGVIRRSRGPGDPEILLHAIVVGNVLEDRSPFAVCEFLSPDRHKQAIAGCLARFVQQ